MVTKVKSRRAPGAGLSATRALESRLTKEAIEHLGTGVGWENWLRVRRQFRQEPLWNQWLISAQRPDATSLAGYARWRGLGYAVRKGERAIRIWAVREPSPPVLSLWPQQGSTPGEAPCPVSGLAPVFDRSQVSPVLDLRDEPELLPTPLQPLDGDGLAEHFEPLLDLGRSLGLVVEIERIRGAACGYHEPAIGRVAIERLGLGFSANAQLSVLIGEIARALVRVDHTEDDPRLDCAAEPVVAESVGVAICATLGLMGDRRLLPRHDDWFARTEGEPIELYATMVDRLARRVEGIVCLS
jgi:hypothetical protein